MIALLITDTFNHFLVFFVKISTINHLSVDYSLQSLLTEIVLRGKLWSSGQDGGVGRCTALHFLAQTKEDNNQLKNKKQPHLPGNQTAWKSNNKELKNKHSSRMVEGVEMGSLNRDVQQGGSWQQIGAGEAVAGRLGYPSFVYR